MDRDCFLVKTLDVRELTAEVLGAWGRFAIDQGRKLVEVQKEVESAYLRVVSAVPGSHPVYAALHGHESEEHPVNASLVACNVDFRSIR